jgi:hypothetical protein
LQGDLHISRGIYRFPRDLQISGGFTYFQVIYVAGNAGALVWRANITSGKFVKMWDSPDVAGRDSGGDSTRFLEILRGFNQIFWKFNPIFFRVVSSGFYCCFFPTIK